MPEPLYRIGGIIGDVDNRLIAEWVSAGVLVPVERCEHGNGHIINHRIVTRNGETECEWDWCPGAGIGDNDAA